ncbi:DsbA family protein [Kitasatospora sp. NBC_01287]|uniref:DsbA family protein n=1 Tax=Kitasatospora sp. NBC_01287 TaxID=2903573 RepID=UPI002252CFA2|nr:thioredoxin domain-containing protein [Kitasatospora sp. NBC_01287]MCX4749887.1 DsbA family protein [Kitasatospora sp. NBC_01287]
MSSKPNKPQNHQQKSTARREALHEARLREQQAETRRRRIVIGVSAALVLALCGGVAIAVSGGSGHSGGAAASAPVVAPANTSGPNGTVITYGNANAPHTLDVYEDFRCPICKKFETSDGQAVQALADNGTYKIQYHMAAFLDDNLGGKGSITALAAAGAALNQSPADFKKFHDALYANQPDEQTDGYGDVNTVLYVAAKAGLNSDAFVNAVKANTYLPWAQQVATAFNSSGVTGTPTMKLDGKQLTLFDSSGNPISADQYTALIQQSAGTK